MKENSYLEEWNKLSDYWKKRLNWSIKKGKKDFPDSYYSLDMPFIYKRYGVTTTPTPDEFLLMIDVTKDLVVSLDDDPNILEILPALRTLDLRCYVPNLATILPKFTRLEKLTVNYYDSYSDDLSFLSKLNNLQELSIRECAASCDLSFLAFLQNLKAFHLEFDEGVRGIKIPQNLKSLSASLETIVQIKEVTNITRLVIDESNFRSKEDHIVEKENFRLYRKFPKLQSLRWDYAVIDNLTFEGLNNIEDLALVNRLSPINDSDFLVKLKKLKFLCFHNYYVVNPIKIDTSILKTLTQITELHLGSNAVTNLDGLQNLKKLRHLSLENNKITDISPLADLKDLEKINLENNKVKDLTPLKGCKNLNYLYLTNNSISDISPIENLKKLKELKIGNNEITDIHPLWNLTKLESLSFFNNPKWMWLKEDIAAFKERLNNLVIGNDNLSREDNELLKIILEEKMPNTTIRLKGEKISLDELITNSNGEDEESAGNFTPNDEDVEERLL